jgi:hypothetical protein
MPKFSSNVSITSNFLQIFDKILNSGVTNTHNFIIKLREVSPLGGKYTKLFFL